MTLDLHEDGLLLCENGDGLSYGSLSASHLVYEGCMAVVNDVSVVENMRTASMMVRKSRVEIVIWCGGSTEVLAAAPSGGAVLGSWGPEKTEGSGADGTGAGWGEAGTEGAEA